MLEIPESKTISLQAERTLTVERLPRFLTPRVLINSHFFIAILRYILKYLMESRSYQQKDMECLSTSAKAVLATEQRVPGIGNGVLQDILFYAGIHPKRKKSTLTNKEKGELFHSLKSTLKNMTDQGGRDTEKDFLGNSGGYKTILSKNTVNQPCLKCGDLIVKNAYLGGAVYYCPACQRL
jgi:formamidopyrimidine-DNA glycosylase